MNGSPFLMAPLLLHPQLVFHFPWGGLWAEPLPEGLERLLVGQEWRLQTWQELALVVLVVFLVAHWEASLQFAQVSVLSLKTTEQDQAEVMGREWFPWQQAGLA